MSILARLSKKIGNIYNRLCNKTIILAYHRVANLKTDSQLLGVFPENFEQHLDIIRKYYKSTDLQGLGNQLRLGKIANKSVVITFDDGYVDNLIYGKPLLEKYDIPATVFVTTGLINKNEELWWDELERIILLPEKLPKELSIKIDDQLYSWDLSQGFYGSLLSYPDWNVTKPNIPGMRFKMYKDLHVLLKPLSYEVRQEILKELRSLIGCDNYVRDYYRICNFEEIKKLRAGGLVEVGSHTVTHPIMSKSAIDEQKEEILQSKHQLEKILGENVSSFSYPYGGINDIGADAPKLVQSVGFSVAVANYAGLVTKKSNPFLLPRFLVRNWTGDYFEKQLRGWFGE